MMDLQKKYSKLGRVMVVFLGLGTLGTAIIKFAGHFLFSHSSFSFVAFDFVGLMLVLLIIFQSLWKFNNQSVLIAPVRYSTIGFCLYWCSHLMLKIYDKYERNKINLKKGKYSNLYGIQDSDAFSAIERIDFHYFVFLLFPLFFALLLFFTRHEKKNALGQP